MFCYHGLALTTLVARPASIEARIVRLIQGVQRKDFDLSLTKNFGELNPSNAERQAEIVRYRKFLSDESILTADLKNSRAIFLRTCSACHTRFGQGGHIGPELPGNFTDIDYLLQNILDPNAIIGRDYQQTFITLKTLAASGTLPNDRIAKRELSPQSKDP